MGQTYILVESEEKRLTLQAVLQDTYEVLVVPSEAAAVEAKNVDHLARGEEGFLFRPVAASHPVLKKLLQAGQGAIYLAFDHSERGEYRSWQWAGMIGQLSKGGLQCRRLHLASLDEEGVSKAMALVEPIDSGQAACFYFEECFQRRFDAHLQRLLGTRTGPGGVPLSIPVLTILALLAEREQDVRDFSGQPKWQVELALQGPRGPFAAQLQEFLGVSCDGTLSGRQQAKEVAEDLAGQSFPVVSRQENSLAIAAPSPYTIYELVFDAYRYCQIPVGDAMQAAISLATGVAVAGKRQALISSLYPVVLSNMQPLVEAVQHYVADQFGSAAVQSRPLEEYGIMPILPTLRPDDVVGLSASQQKIYDLIWRRALASQMPGAVGKEIIVELATEKYRLQNDSRVVETPGFLQIYQYGFESLMAVQVDETLQEGEEAKVVQVVPEQRFGLAPNLYTLPSLAEDLVELGIERPEDMVEIFARLCAADYIESQGNGTLQCGPNLFKVVNTLNRAFPGMQGMNFVVYYAQTVDEVASGRKRFQMALKQFDQNLFLQGKPLVKVKMPASMPTRLKKSKSIIKSDGASLSQESLEVSSAEERAQFVDFSRLVDGAPPQHADHQVEEADEVSLPDVMADVPLAADQGADQEIRAEDKEDVAEVDEGEAAAALDVATPEEADDSIVLDVEISEGQGLVPEESAEQVFQEASLESPGPDTHGGEEPGLVTPSPPARKEKVEGGGEEVATKPCPECGRPMIAKGDRFGMYWACTGMPACRHTEGVRKEEGGEAIPCPLCGEAQLVVKRTPTGKDMYVCPGKACEFMAWSRPHPIHCPLCSSLFLVEKKGVGGAVMLRCPKAGCNYSQGADGSAGPAEPVKKRVVVRRKKGSASGSGKRKVVVRRRKA